MVMMVAVRMPARMTASASGSRTRKRICERVMPWPLRIPRPQVDTGKTDVSVTEDWKKCVKDERDDGGALADAADEWNGNEKPEESKAGDGLEDAGDTEGDGSQSGTLHDEHAKRDADENSDGHGDDYECEVIQRGAEDFATMKSKIKVQGLMRGLPERRKGMK